jgi:starch synthase
MHRVLFVASEAYPLIKTGGLGDVCGSLPPALASLGAEVRLLLPAYRDVLARLAEVQHLTDIYVAEVNLNVSLLEATLPGTRVPVWLLDCPPAYDRPGNPYLDARGQPWGDNAQRFALLARVATRIAQGNLGLAWRPDVVHCHDWQAGLAPALLAQQAERPATVFTIHNLAYQGVFPRSTFVALQLPERLWSMDGLEFHGQLSFMKGGIAFADCVTTVSPTYAREIQTPAFGCGLDGLLRHRAAKRPTGMSGVATPGMEKAGSRRGRRPGATQQPLPGRASTAGIRSREADTAHRMPGAARSTLVGILNGIDTDEWNPQDDRHLVMGYSAERLADKLTNKLALQEQARLPREAHTALIGNVGRLVEQKGIDLVLAALPQLMQLPLQLVILGTGEASYERALRAAAARYPERLAVIIGYDEHLAHRIEAGADMFLMPSRFEPCGLSQLYSLRYGAVPIVHRVGGLADTVVDSKPANLAADTATGVVFDELTPAALTAAVERALALYRQPQIWRTIQRTGMRQDFGWRHSAAEYLKLYGDVRA